MTLSDRSTSDATKFQRFTGLTRARLFSLKTVGCLFGDLVFEKVAALKSAAFRDFGHTKRADQRSTNRNAQVYVLDAEVSERFPIDQ